MDDPCGEDMGLPRPGAGDHEKRTGTMLDGQTLLWLESLEDVRSRFPKTKTELFSHLGRHAIVARPTEGPRAVGHRPEAGGSAPA